MPQDFPKLLNARINLLNQYFAVLDKLFSEGSGGDAHDFFDNEFYRDQKTKLKDEINLSDFLDYFFTYDKSMMMSTSDFLSYFSLSRLSWIVSESVHLTKREVKNDQHIKHIKDLSDYIRFILRLVNQLLAMDIVYPNNKNDTENGYNEKFEFIKKDIVKKFLSELDEENIKGIRRRLELNEIREVDNELIETATDYFWKNAPSLIPKTKGFAEELFVYYYLTTRRKGYYVIPLLLHQRLYSSLSVFLQSMLEFKQRLESTEITDRNKVIEEFINGFRHQSLNYMAIPPDFLVLRKGRIFGVECGGGKENQIVDFSAITGAPTIFVDAEVHLGKSVHGFGLKCDKCYHPFLLCDEYIKRETNGGQKLDEMKIEDRTCFRLCGQNVGSCKYSVITITPTESRRVFGTPKTYNSYYHFSCLTADERSNINSGDLVPPIPIVRNVEKLDIGL